MRSILSRLLLLPLLATTLKGAGSPTVAYLPPYTIRHTVVRTLDPSANGRHYALYVRLPPSFETEPTKRYPVFYACDGYYAFPMLSGIYGNLAYDRVVPEFIIVGMSYAGENLDYATMRQWELSPIPRPAVVRDAGHAAEFLDAIEHEFFPVIENEFRGDPNYRMLGGTSLGGTFTLYAMFTRPELFRAFITPSPTVLLGNEWLLRYEETFHASGRPLHARLFFSAAGNEWPNYVASIQRFRRRLVERNYPGLIFAYRDIDDERHGGTTAEAYTRGLRFALEPLAPESGPLPDLVLPDGN